MKRARSRWLAVIWIVAGIWMLGSGTAWEATGGSNNLGVPLSSIGGKAGAFGVPDPTVGATVLGWFDIGVTGTEDVLPVIVNASNNSYPAGATGYGVHFIVWNVRSQHVWDKDIAFTPWDVESLSIRDTILSMPPAQQNLLVVTLEDGTQRYRGYFTATTVFEFPGNLLPGVDDEYPFLYANDLGGWVYLTNLLEGQADGYAMVSVEASTLWAGYLPDVFMMSLSADFWNREWWWTCIAAAVQGNFFTTKGLYSRLWNCSLNGFWYRDSDSADADALPDTPFQDDKVFERFDAAAGINAQLLTRGLMITSDDAWLGKTMRVSTPYDKGGMLLVGRYFKDEAASIANTFANKLVLWADRNGEITGTRQVQAVVYDEEENAISLPIFFPDELTVLQLDELVGTNPAGIIVLDTRQIQYSNGQNPIMGFLLQDYNEDGVINLNPFSLSCPPTTFIHPNLLQLLGWTTTQALAQADLTWGAAFQMIRDYEIGTPANLFAFEPGFGCLIWVQ